MYQFFNSVLGFLETFWEFFLQVWDSLFLGYQLIINSIIFPLELAGFLPSFLSTCILITVAVGVVKFLVGR